MNTQISGKYAVFDRRDVLLKYLSRASGQNQRYGVCSRVSWAAWALCLDAWVRGKEKEELYTMITSCYAIGCHA